MGVVEKVYKRLLLHPPFDKKRKRRLDNLFHLSNYRVRTVGISQIRTTHFHFRKAHVFTYLINSPN
ncbi:hypothetical protein GQ600_19665 [Phytophthora cactorum]|nr:hypothetical protein GQ600_19665 [Phytophthora cactorum]